MKRTQSFPSQTTIVSFLTRFLQVPLGASLLIAVALPAAAQASPAPTPLAPASQAFPPSASPSPAFSPSVEPAVEPAPAENGALPLLTPNLPPINPVLPETLPASSTVRLVLKLSERRVYVYEGNQVKASYPVAIGRPGWETPTGSFAVKQKLENPGWTNPFTGEQMPPGPDNPLGERWIGFWTDGQNWVGFHGTPSRESVGTAASHGCVRMYNEDVRRLYQLVQVGTPVTVER